MGLVHRPEISSGAKIVYGFLARNTSHPDYPDANIASGIKHTDIALALGVSARSVRNWLGELVNEKLIHAETVGWGRSNFYRFLRHPWQADPPPGS